MKDLEKVKDHHGHEKGVSPEVNSKLDTSSLHRKEKLLESIKQLPRVYRKLETTILSHIAAANSGSLDAGSADFPQNNAEKELVMDDDSFWARSRFLWHGQAPLHIAAEHGRGEIVRRERDTLATPKEQIPGNSQVTVLFHVSTLESDTAVSTDGENWCLIEP